jgi:hypothetical protein
MAFPRPRADLRTVATWLARGRGWLSGACPRVDEESGGNAWCAAPTPTPTPMPRLRVVRRLNDKGGTGTGIISGGGGGIGSDGGVVVVVGRHGDDAPLVVGHVPPLLRRIAVVVLSDEARKPRAFCRPVDLDTVPRDGCTRFARRGNPLGGGGRTLSLRGFISLRSNPLRFARRGNPLGGGCLALSLHSLLEHRRLDSLPLGKGWHVGVELRERRRWLRDGSRGHAMQARHRHPE